MERVSSDVFGVGELASADVFGVEELAHVIETDRESAWLLALGPDPPVPGAGGASQRR